MIDWSILMVYKPVKGYGITFIVRLTYLHFCVFLRVLILLHTKLLNASNFYKWSKQVPTF